MRIFRKKILLKLIASLCIFLTILNFGYTKPVFAGGEEDEDEVAGSILITPITQLFTSLADGIITILQEAVLEQNLSIVEISGADDWWDSWGKVVLTLLVTIVICAVAAYLLPGGMVVGILLVGAIEVASAVTIGSSPSHVAATWVVERFSNAWFDKTLYMPIFTLTPEEIFSNKIALFDTNFFNPNEYKTTEIKQKKLWFLPGYGWDSVNFVNKKYTYEENQIIDWDNENESKIDPICDDLLTAFAQGKENNEYVVSLGEVIINRTVNNYADNGLSRREIIHIFENINKKLGKDILPTSERDDIWDWKIIFNCKQYTPEGDGGSLENSFTIMSAYGDRLFRVHLKNTFKGDGIDNYSIKVERICELYTEVIEEPIEKTTEGISAQLRSIVSQWYFILRNLALLVLMLVLIYSGIRIVIGSTAGEKAKYKERLMDWLVAMCLVFIMHYIMVFAMETVESITKLIDSIDGLDGFTAQIDLTEKQLENYNEEGEAQASATGVALKEHGKIREESGQTVLEWSTNLMGAIKIKAQQVNEGTDEWLGASLCYIVLVLQTLFFAWSYVKRVIYIAFLTMIAPLVAMTYPIDKITDGKAQAFSMWLKEYIFNLLIQPLHLLLYLVLVGSAYELASTTPFYAVVAIGFMMPAEKLVRNFFGFNKAQTPGMLGGAAGAALAFTGLQKLMRMGNKKHSKPQDKNHDDKIRFKNRDDKNPMDAIVGDDKGKSEGIRTTENKADTEQKSSPTDNSSQSKQQGTPQVEDPKTETSNEQPKAVPVKNTKSETPAKNTTAATKNNGNKKVIKTAKSAAKAYTRQLGKKMKNRFKKARPVRALARGVTGIAGAATLGMAGLALGVAGGDASKAFQYTTAGITGGYGLGKGVAGSVVDTLSVDTHQIREDAELEWYGQNYKDAKRKEQNKKYVEDEDNINYMRKMLNLSREEAEEALKTTGTACLDSGISDISDIATVHKMTKNKVDIDKAIAAKKFNEFLPKDLSNMGKTDRDDHIDRWTDDYQEYKGFDEDTARHYAEISMKLAEEYNKTKSSLKKA